MVRRTPRDRAHVHTGRLDIEVLVDDDPVELGHGMPRMKAGPGRREVELGLELIEAAGNGTPLVGIAHEHGRHLVGPPIDRIEDRPHLPLSPQAGQIEVHADNAQRLLTDQEFRDHRSAWFEGWQFERRAVEYPDMALHQDRIAVPADIARVDLQEPVGVPPRLVEHAFVADTKVHRLVHAMTVDQLVGHGRAASADALVGFLQRDDVSVDFLEDTKHAMRIAAAVETDRLVHVVGRERDAGAAAHAQANRPCRRMVPRRRGWQRSAHCPG